MHSSVPVNRHGVFTAGSDSANPLNELGHEERRGRRVGGCARDGVRDVVITHVRQCNRTAVVHAERPLKRKKNTRRSESG